MRGEQSGKLKCAFSLREVIMVVVINYFETSFWRKNLIKRKQLRNFPNFYDILDSYLRNFGNKLEAKNTKRSLARSKKGKVFTKFISEN